LENASRKECFIKAWWSAFSAKALFRFYTSNVFVFARFWTDEAVPWLMAVLSLSGMSVVAWRQGSIGSRQSEALLGTENSGLVLVPSGCSFCVQKVCVL